LKPTIEQVELAILITKHSRDSHMDALNYIVSEKLSEWKGTPEFHAGCVAEYEYVMRVLEGFRDGMVH
jgi:hypothetical protein